jgi:regulator of sigma E protease
MTELLSFPAYILFGTLLVLTLVVFIHELGHFLVARWCGISVDIFSIGFGKELVGFDDRRGTRWRLSAIPLGGYVKFTGDENASSMPDAAALEAIPEERRAGLFHFAPLWKRAAIVAAGPIANFLLAISIFAVLFSTLGRPVTLPVVDSVVPDSPAEAAGIQPGDRIVAIDRSQIQSFSDIQRIVTLSSGDKLRIMVERGGERVELIATPERRERPDGFGGTQRIGMLGITASRLDASDEVTYQRYGPVEAVIEGVEETGEIIELTLTYVKRLFTGRESVDQLSGPVRIAHVSGVIASTAGLIGLINLSAILSVSIGLLNLFPVPMLDGGHLMFYAVEAVRGRPLSQRMQEMGFRIGFALVIMLFVFVTFNDIIKLAGI